MMQLIYSIIYTKDNMYLVKKKNINVWYIQIIWTTYLKWSKHSVMKFCVLSHPWIAVIDVCCMNVFISYFRQYVEPLLQELSPGQGKCLCNDNWNTIFHCKWGIRILTKYFNFLVKIVLFPFKIVLFKWKLY